jgi:predicted HD superfamily hydrolase involved in NAD metabolism
MIHTLTRLGPAVVGEHSRESGLQAGAEQAPTQFHSWLPRVQLMVKPRRFEHVMRVAELARDIARANGINPQLAYWAGVLHDVARDLPDSELLRLAPPECAIDSAHPLALHGRAGRALLEHWGLGGQGLGIQGLGSQGEDQRVILEAVEDHATGPRVGNGVSACVYIADVSEPGRGVNADIRELALRDLQGALQRAIVSKVTYLQGRGIEVHPRTLATYHSLAVATPS